MNVHLGPQLPDEIVTPDVYFTPGYGRADSVADCGEWALLEAFDGAWQVPLIVRTLADGVKDATSPYGYSGVYASPCLSSEQIQQAWSATVSTLRERGVISALLRHSPLVTQAPEIAGMRSVVSGHPTIVLEPADHDAAWSNMESRCRNQTRKALKNGYTGGVRQVSDQDLVADGVFRRLYEQTMARQEATSWFYFSDAYYRELRTGLGPDLFIAEVRDPAGEVVSSTLLLRHGKRLHYHLTGSNVSDARMGANNLMVWAATEFAVEQGLTQFHLGGGRDERDDLFRFKRKFGGRELEYRVSGLVVDPDGCQYQVERRAKECDTTPEELMAGNYFPAYRGGTTHV